MDEIVVARERSDGAGFETSAPKPPKVIWSLADLISLGCTDGSESIEEMFGLWIIWLCCTCAQAAVYVLRLLIDLSAMDGVGDMQRLLSILVMTGSGMIAMRLRWNVNMWSDVRFWIISTSSAEYVLMIIGTEGVLAAGICSFVTVFLSLYFLLHYICVLRLTCAVYPN